MARLWSLLGVGCLLTSVAYPADVQWRSLGPGGGGWIQSVACDPRTVDTLYLGATSGASTAPTTPAGLGTIHNQGLTDYFVQCLALCPGEPATILLGAEGGVFKSVDGGRSWSAKRSGFAAPSRWGFTAPIGGLCFDPTRPNVVYAGIGRPRWGKDGQGAVYRSDDCGETWRRVSPPGQFARPSPRL